MCSRIIRIASHLDTYFQRKLEVCTHDMGIEKKLKQKQKKRFVTKIMKTTTFHSVMRDGFC